MRWRIRMITAGIVFGCLLGCGSATVSKDGTAGALWFGTETVGDICVVAHRRDGVRFQQVGFGTTDQSGFFNLLKIGGQDPLLLEPGDYVFTLESVGPQIDFPTVYLQPELTPLKVAWSTGMTMLDLQAPEQLIAALTW